MAPTRSFTTQQAAAQIAQADEYWNGDMGDPADNGFRFSGQQIVTSIEALTERRGPITLTQEDFSMSPGHRVDGSLVPGVLCSKTVQASAGLARTRQVSVFRIFGAVSFACSSRPALLSVHRAPVTASE